MYINLVPLQVIDHADLRLQPVTDYSYARSELLAPIVIDEIADVAREFPIIFPTGRNVPVALMGVEKDSNAYVSPDGRWRAAYVPAALRQYPFAISPVGSGGQGSDEGEAPLSEREFGLYIDMGSRFVVQGHGERIFEMDGRLAPAAEKKLEVMRLLQQRAGETRRLVKAIEAAGLLAERNIVIKKENGPSQQVTGFRMIDERALNALPDTEFNKLRAAGALPLVFAALLSWANFRRGPFGQSHQLPA